MNPYPACDPGAVGTVIGVLFLVVIGVLFLVVIGLVMLLILLISGEKRK